MSGPTKSHDHKIMGSQKAIHFVQYFKKKKKKKSSTHRYNIKVILSMF